ncbi:MAG: PEP-utilizing enzyme [Parcubacteria group bacterium]|jgi:phosphohistidine swiveling domain-containing protein
MKIKKVLAHLLGLLEKWGIPSEDWILTGQYADRMQGYEVKVRKGHLNILVPRAKIPWRIGRALEAHAPAGTSQGNQFQKFLKETGFEFDFLPMSSGEFKKNVKKTVRYSLRDGREILLLAPIGELKLLKNILEKSNEKAWGTEKGRRILGYVEEFANELKRKNEKEDSEAYSRVAEKYKYLKKTSIQKRGRKKEIRGLTAYAGKAKGIARIIGEASKTKFDRGNILVTKMTSPKFTPLMLKAAAIVTDIGGQLCHAAITSRELKIPCIVGAKSATKIIHDGDMIKVDAGRGIIKIMK